MIRKVILKKNIHYCNVLIIQKKVFETNNQKLI